MPQAEKTGKVMGDEPRLVIDQNAAQGAVVAFEGSGGMEVVHERTPGNG